MSRMFRYKVNLLTPAGTPYEYRAAQNSGRWTWVVPGAGSTFATRAEAGAVIASMTPFHRGELSVVITTPEKEI